MVKISIILTTYNSENYLQGVIDSITNQEGNSDLFELEILVVDDCSTDTTQSILLKNDIPFQINTKNTGGPNYGRNLALSMSTGDYICIADHDDIWLPNKIKKLLSVVDFAPIISSGYILSDKSLKKDVSRVNNSVDNIGYILYKKNETFISKLTKSQVGQQTYLGSIMFCSSLKHILFEEEYGMIDFDWVLRLFYNQRSVEICDALYVRKVDGSNLFLDQTYRIRDYKYSLRTVDKYKNEYFKEVQLSIKRINGSMARYYYLIGDMRLARVYFLKSEIGFKMILYFITTFVGSRLVKRYFKVFG